MVRKYKTDNLDTVMAIWLETNISAHDFIKETYWKNNYAMVKDMLPDANIYVFEEDNLIKGFVGVMDNGYIAGIFVLDKFQKQGIGQFLLNHIILEHQTLSLSVYKKNDKAIKFYMKNNFVIKEENIDEDNNEIEYQMERQA